VRRTRTVSIDDPILHPEASDLGDAVPYVRKQDLAPDTLRRLWTTHHRGRER